MKLFRDILVILDLFFHDSPDFPSLQIISNF